MLDPRTVIEHAVIACAGADSQTRGVCASNAAGDNDADSAVIVYPLGESAPERAFITNSTLRDSANGGIYRSWQGADLDFTAGNTFERIAGCRQRGLRRAADGCTSPGCT